jgi:hypothetical protein
MQFARQMKGAEQSNSVHKQGYCSEPCFPKGVGCVCKVVCAREVTNVDADGPAAAWLLHAAAARLAPCPGLHAAQLPRSHTDRCIDKYYESWRSEAMHKDQAWNQTHAKLASLSTLSKYMPPSEVIATCG